MMSDSIQPNINQTENDDGESDRVSVLVHFEPPGRLVSALVAQKRRQDVRDWVETVGGKVKYEYSKVLPHVVNLRNIPQERLNSLQAKPGIVMVEEDKVMRAHLTASTPLVQGLQSQTSNAGYSADGSGVRVCVIDTGIDSEHIMFADRIDESAGRDFVNTDNDPEDDNGHGTHVAGIVLGGTGLLTTRCDYSISIQGVAPEAELIGVKVLRADGGGWMSDVIEGIDYCADQGSTGGRADVINLSLGGGQFSGNCDQDSTAEAANNAVNAGIVVVASSGNEAFSNAMVTPACGSKVIAVGAVYDDDFPNCEHGQSSFSWCADSDCQTTLCTDNNILEDDLICFSNKSDTIDVVAPGCIITSAAISPENDALSGKCGTSQASPHVAGLAALLLSQDPSLTPTLVRQHIRDGAYDLGDLGFDKGYRYGRIDVINSLSFLNIGCNSNGICESGEDCNNCASDCSGGTMSGAVCGNGICETGDGEDCISCPSDCNGIQGGKLTNRFCCGDGDGRNSVGCSDLRCSNDDWSCTADPVFEISYCCGDSICSAGAEDWNSCSLDCQIPVEELDCSNGEDDDNDGYIDCADIIDCKDDPFCQGSGGSGLPGDFCSADSDCLSNKCVGKPGSKSCK